MSVFREKTHRSTRRFCDNHSLHYKSMMEIRSLRMQLSQIVNSVDATANVALSSKMEPPDNEQQLIIRQVTRHQCDISRDRW